MCGRSHTFPMDEKFWWTIEVEEPQEQVTEQGQEGAVMKVTVANKPYLV